MDKKSNVTFSIVGALLGILWLFPFYLIVSNSFKTQKGIFPYSMSLYYSYNNIKKNAFFQDFFDI